MRIFVCIKQVPDTETKIKIKPDGTGIETAGIKWVMNPYDEYAVEEALKIREAGKATNVTVLSVGPKARVSEALRTALAMGADDAIVIDTGAETAGELDQFATAKALAAAIKAEGEFKIILTGKLAIDDNASAVSQMLAEMLGAPHATVVSKLTVDAENLIAEREVEGGTREVIQLQMPALIAANKGLNLPRYASLPGIMKAKKKTIKEVALDSLQVSAGDNKIKFNQFQMPAEKPAVKMLAGDPSAQAVELARLLREEAKVI